MTGAPDLGPFRVERSARWHEADGRLVVEIPRPQARGLRAVGAFLSWWTGPRRIRLDALGASVWRRCDGTVTVAEVVEAMQREHPEEAESMADRIGLFLATLQREGLVRFLEGDDGCHEPGVGEARYSAAGPSGDDAAGPRT